MTRFQLLSPLVAFPVLWVVAAAAAQLHALNVQRPWSTNAWLVVALVPIAFAAGGAAAELLARRVSRVDTPTPRFLSRVGLRVAIVALLVLGTAELVHQFAAAGVIPLLSGNVDDARFALPGGPSVVLVHLLVAAAIVAVVVPRRMSDRTARPYLAVGAFALVALALTGGRGPLVAALVVGTIARGLYRGFPHPAWLAATVLAVTAVFSAVFFLRLSQHATGAFETEVYEQVLLDVPWPLWPLLPLHFALALNFEALARLVDYIPAQEPFGHGVYNAAAFDLVIPGARDVQDLSAQLSPPWVTSTVAGPLWADGGFAAVALGVFLVGFVTTAAFAVARRTRRLCHLLPASYLLYMAVFGVYFNLFTQYVEWLVVVPVLWAVGSIADRERIATAGEAAVPRSSPRRGRIAFAAVVAAALALVGGVSATVRLAPRESLSARTELYALDAAHAYPVRALLSTADSRGNARLFLAAGTTVLRLYAVPLPARRHLGHNGVEQLRPAMRVGANLRVPARAKLDVIRWRGRDAVAVAVVDRRGVRVRVLDLRTGRLLASGLATLALQPALTTRVTDLATLSGPLPDLYVIDTGGPATAPALTVFSGESGFRRQLMRLPLPLRNLDAASTVYRVARVEGPLPDLVVFKRRGQSHRLELHVLSGERGYRSFLLQRPTSIESERALRYRFVVGARLGATRFFATRPYRFPSILEIAPIL